MMASTETACPACGRSFALHIPDPTIPHKHHPYGWVNLGNGGIHCSIRCARQSGPGKITMRSDE